MGTESRWRHEALALAVLTAATLAACWPWVVGSRVFAQRDTAFTSLAMEHLIRTPPWGWLQGPLGWPLQDSVAQADWVLGEALMAWPLRALGADPLVVHSALVVIGLLASAWTLHLVSTALLGPGPHTWLAGVVGGLGPMQLAHAQHVNLVHHELAIGGALLLAVGLARDRAVLAGAGAALAVLGFHLGIYLGVQGVFLLGVVALGAVIARKGGVRTWLAGAAGAGMAGLTVLPVLVVYHRFASRYGISLPREELVEGSWHLGSTWAPVPLAPLHAPLVSMADLGGMGDLLLTYNPPNPGYLATLLALGGLVVLGRRLGTWTWGTVLALTVLTGGLALGPTVQWSESLPLGPGPWHLVDAFTPLEALRVPARWLALCFAGVGLLGAAAAKWLLQRTGKPWLAALAAAVLVAVAVGESPHPITMESSRADLPALYRGVAALAGGGAVYDEGIHGTGGHRAEPLLGGVVHGRPLLGGRYSRYVPASVEIDVISSTWPSPEAHELLSAAGVTVVVDHPPLAAAHQVSGRCTRYPGGQLCVLDRRDGAIPPGAVTAVRWEEVPTAARVGIACGARQEQHSTRVWAALGATRDGVRAEGLEVVLDEPCTERVVTVPAGGVPLD